MNDDVMLHGQVTATNAEVMEELEHAAASKARYSTLGSRVWEGMCPGAPPGAWHVRMRLCGS